MSRTIFGLAITILLTAAIASAQVEGTVDVSGDWELQTSAFFEAAEGQVADCEFAGSTVITQDGAELGGTASLTLTGGDPECPAEMSADVDGTVTGNTIEMGLLMGGQLGTAEWSGTVDPQGRPEGHPQGPEGEGGTGGPFTVDSGPFSGTIGTWSAQRPVGGPSVLEIPTLTALGIVALVALLLAAAAVMLRRLSTPSAPSA